MDVYMNVKNCVYVNNFVYGWPYWFLLTVCMTLWISEKIKDVKFDEKSKLKDGTFEKIWRLDTASFEDEAVGHKYFRP